MTRDPGRAMMAGSAARQMSEPMNPASSITSRSTTQPRIRASVDGTDRILLLLLRVIDDFWPSVTLVPRWSEPSARSVMSARTRLDASSPEETMRTRAPGLLNAVCRLRTESVRLFAALAPGAQDPVAGRAPGHLRLVVPRRGAVEQDLGKLARIRPGGEVFSFRPRRLRDPSPADPGLPRSRGHGTAGAGGRRRPREVGPGVGSRWRGC